MQFETTAGPERSLSAPELSRQRTVKGKVRRCDLRLLVHEVWYDSSGGGAHVVGMVLVNRGTGAGRVGEVVMGTVVEIWEAYRAGKLGWAASPLMADWAQRFRSTRRFHDLDEFVALVSQGGLDSVLA